MSARPRTAVADLAGAELDYWVARARGTPAEHLYIEIVPRTDIRICVDVSGAIPARFDPSTSWAVGGPLLDTEIAAEFKALSDAEWQCEDVMTAATGRGPTHLIAAMRAYVASVYGATIEATP
nr:phage protein NinX family protein [Massilia aquatica]